MVAVRSLVLVTMVLPVIVRPGGGDVMAANHVAQRVIDEATCREAGETLLDDHAVSHRESQIHLACVDAGFGEAYADGTTATAEAEPSTSHPPAVPTATARDAHCAELEEGWVAGPLAVVPFDAIATDVLGCWRGIDGGWFVPTGYDDPRLVGGPILTADEWRATANIRDTIVERVARFAAALPPWVRAEIDRLRREYTTENGRPLPGAGPQEPADGDYASILRAYGDTMAVELLDPEAIELAAFVGWWHGRRVTAVPQEARSASNPFLASVVAGELQLDRYPWPWEVGDPIALALFLRWGIDHGFVLIP